MMLQGIRRVVRGAEDADLGLAAKGPGGHGFELFIAPLPDLTGGGGGEQVIDPKVALQLQRRPVVHGVAQAIRHRRGKCLKALPITGRAGAERFADTIAPHGPPLVVITVEPDLREIVPCLVLGYLLRRQVIVVVDDGLVLRVAVIQLNGSRGIKEEVVMDKGHESWP
jgi:hypothetical protein